MNEEPITPAKSPGARRGRKPRHPVPQEEFPPKAQSVSSLKIRRERLEGAIVLRLSGELESEAIITLRDSAFTAIGARPRDLCVDLRQVTEPLDLPAMEALVTIVRVAKMMQVCFSVIVPPPLAPTWGMAGLSCLLPLQNDPRFFQPMVKPKFVLGVSGDSDLCH